MENKKKTELTRNYTQFLQNVPNHVMTKQLFVLYDFLETTELQTTKSGFFDVLTVICKLQA